MDEANGMKTTEEKPTGCGSSGWHFKWLTYVKSGKPSSLETHPLDTRRLWGEEGVDWSEVRQWDGKRSGEPRRLWSKGGVKGVGWIGLSRWDRHLSGGEPCGFKTSVGSGRVLRGWI